MKLFIIVITLFLMWNTYNDNAFIKKLYTYKKHGQMLLIAVCGCILYWLVTYCKPHKLGSILSYVHLLFNRLPMHATTKSIVNNSVEFGKHFLVPTQIATNTTDISEPAHIAQKSSTFATVKRSVSEPRKKLVASNQSWKCKKCNTLLSAWFEVDHVQALQHGGTNEVDNLVALCRECHGKKTFMDRL